ncbi:hypothetical protein HanXRQr2_Chr12g0536111 [Helianthus annuus]|uniref:Uncharacterized protein n=1 Tax=Helianthus annuus TaxID=4232 RepID=A0A251T1I5_HELAN|nr:hypothetical protein HanXRQr2_Chr12g0536111 [Helianthus annuus]KAJ0492675.1 hypothetical protein HanIR_Chr12g0577531 [Helianthus annuus]KAJ0504881.1 hypothetical protein HanHA89_Chr12g0464201 [Helianthus annuus]KAJ0862287.1 hypothetical protein HanPSC8_Chr12g0516401 [Helianthus annuus]
MSHEWSRVSASLKLPGSVSKHNLENSLKKMCKEGAYWGTIAGVYVGMEYGVEGVRGVRDWVNINSFMTPVL